MNVLLVDSNQKSYSFLAEIDHCTVIQFPPFSEWLSLDAIMTEFIENQIDLISGVDLIILPLSVTANYLEFSGLRLAHHIRLTSRYYQNPLMLIGDLELNAVYKLTEYSEILSTRSVYYTSPSKIDIETLIRKSTFEKLNNLDQYLSRVNIKPPSNYESHHSIANELALLRWSEVIDSISQIPEVIHNIQTNLYFKYIRALNPINLATKVELLIIDKTAKILLIDDEAEKGWFQFYKLFFKLNSGIKVDYLKINFKELTRENIIEQARLYIENFDPDVVLLDLRLCDGDFQKRTNSKVIDLSGIEILKDIKKINNGIQVIVTTASDKVWNHQESSFAGANGYIIKSVDSDVNQDIENLKHIIKNAIERSSDLKRIATSFKIITELVVKSSDLSVSFKESTPKNLEVAFKLLEEKYHTPKYISYSYLQLFLIIEEYLKEENVFIEDDLSYVMAGDKEYLVLKRLEDLGGRKVFDSAIKMIGGHYLKGYDKYDRFVDTNFKMSAVLLFKFGVKTSGEFDWTKIYKTRNNKAAHPKVGIVTIEEYVKLVEFLKFIFNAANNRLVDEKYGLLKPTIEESLNKLKEKFGR